MHTPQEPCPSAAMLAAYLDGKLMRAERGVVERHVANCEDCFEQLAGAMAFQLEEVGQGSLVHHPSVPGRTARWRIAAVAAAVIAAVALWSAVRERTGVRGAPEALAWADRLGGAAELKIAATLPWSDAGGGLAFGGALPPTKRAFRLGVHLLDARVALAAQEREAFVAAVERAAPLLPRTAEGEAAAIVERLRRPASGTPGLRADLDRLAGAAGAIDPSAFELGAWAEAGRLGSQGRATGFLASELAARLDELAAAPAAADPAVGRELEAIRRALADRRVGAGELPDLERAFERLLLLN